MPYKVLFIGEDEAEGILVEHIFAKERKDVVRWLPYGNAVLTEAEQDAPDLIMVQFTIPHPNVFDLCQQLRAVPALEDTPISLWRVTVPDRVCEKARGIGLQGYLSLPYTSEELLAARDALMRGGTYFP